MPKPTDASPKKSEKLSDQVYAFVFANIMDGAYPEGSRLPTEGQLAEQFGFSRPIIREALARLRDDGVIVSRQGSGSYVQAMPGGSSSRFGHLQSIADLERCNEFRVEVESAAAALAAVNATPGDLTAIRAAMAALEEIALSDDVGMEADFEFHKAIAEATGNRFFLGTLNSLKKPILFGMLLGRQFALKQPDERVAVVIAEHARIVDAIGRKDGEAARDAMRRHLLASARRTFHGDR